MTELKQNIEENAYHSYVQQYLDKPSIDHDKLILLWSMFNEIEISEDETKTYITAIMLVQIALDTHELVTNSWRNEENSLLIKNRQLTVLSGDLYSGLYYKILAETKNLKLIRFLSHAIKEMNEQKIIVYERTPSSKIAFLESLEVIEAALLFKVADYINKPDWKQLAGKRMLLNRLVLEKNLILENNKSIVADNFARLLFPADHIEGTYTDQQKNMLVNEIDQCIESVNEWLKQAAVNLSNRDDIIKKCLNAKFEQAACTVNTFVEEG
jgi:heptaprenyl diphosphate synthase